MHLIIVLAALAFTFFCINGIKIVHQDLDEGKSELIITLGYDCLLMAAILFLWLIGCTLILMLRDDFKP